MRPSLRCLVSIVGCPSASPAPSSRQRKGAERLKLFHADELVGFAMKVGLRLPEVADAFPRSRGSRNARFLDLLHGMRGRPGIKSNWTAVPVNGCVARAW